MKTLAVWTLMAAVMIASQPSYAYGDLLFHGILKNVIEDKRMPDVAPTYPTAAPCSGATTAGVSRHHTQAELDEDKARIDHSCGEPPMISVSQGASTMGFGVSTTRDESICSPAVYAMAARGALAPEVLQEMDHMCGKYGRAPVAKPMNVNCTVKTSQYRPHEDYIPVGEGWKWIHKDCVGAALPWQDGDVTLPLDINKDRCTADTYIAAAQAQLSDEELTALDKYCRGKADRNPMGNVNV